MDINKYVLHSTGIYALFTWIHQYELKNIKTYIRFDTIELEEHIGNYFCLGVSKHLKSNKYPFLGCQALEEKWLSFLQFDRIVIRENDSKLYLITKFIEGDKENYPDIGVFAIAIPFAIYDKLILLKDIKYLDLRSFYIEDDEVIINNVSYIARLPINYIAANQNIFKNDEKLVGVLKQDIIRNKIEKTNRYHLPDSLKD